MPRLEIDLDKIYHNASTLVSRLALRGITVSGVTKATIGSRVIASVLVRAGVSSLGDSRLGNIETMRRAGIHTTLMLIRSPMLSQVSRVVREVDLSFNTELEVLGALSSAAKERGKTHGIVLMVELGDCREGIMPCDLEEAVRQTQSLPNLQLKGIGTNLACYSGVAPDERNMAELSYLADETEATFGLTLEIVSGGNSANLPWALSEADTGRINHLRLGESILLGRETLHRQPIDGLHTDAFTLVAEVIESKQKPGKPWGEAGQTAFGIRPTISAEGDISQAILALGRQDVDPQGLFPPSGITVLGASSDHLVVDCGSELVSVGSEMAFQVDYSALVRGMTCPFVEKVMENQGRGNEIYASNL